MKPEWNRMKIYTTEDGIRLEYREYPNCYTVWALKGASSLKLETGKVSLKYPPNPEDCFERVLQIIEQKDPFA